MAQFLQIYYHLSEITGGFSIPGYIMIDIGVRDISACYYDHSKKLVRVICYEMTKKEFSEVSSLFKEHVDEIASILAPKGILICDELCELIMDRNRFLTEVVCPSWNTPQKHFTGRKEFNHVQFTNIGGHDISQLDGKILDLSEEGLNQEPTTKHFNNGKHPNNLPEKKRVNQKKDRRITQPRERTGRANYNNRNKAVFRNFNVNKQKAQKK
jgi:hypothetical protein